ncbi:hypothetical protein GQF56_21915 [Rhodobacter sphaeroides]|uniref:Uncharacterized protein n=2 Tax=Cereibacter sphaeroides TaxID=1063 RepID=Q3IZN3_CERS4|nr:hypothetical protein RSP_0822 [Cereibacter sphaeroides 2.4.1]AZB54343.1 hypothetical protein EBL89_03045 [Cereibacter sphaeroides]AXC62205.1 hypothetical protein DQL45_12765 [Cereibacter sphaeroides 2.4.1]AZB58606.1 hypothetical protein EBL88_03075 [Cereibacter sphaeroides]MVX50474.1 hypothetical protein [Cereibacter sphaeroides]
MGMSAIAIRQMVDRVAALMEERLHVRGQDLPAKLRRGAGRLPRRVRAAARDLAQAGEMAQNPRLLMQVDFEKVSADYDLCVRHLGSIDTKTRVAGQLLAALRVLIVGGLVAAGAAYGFARWRGLV